LRFHVLDACPYEIHHRGEILQCCFSNMHGCQLLEQEKSAATICRPRNDLLGEVGNVFNLFK
jgi:hypothetical protein